MSSIKANKIIIVGLSTYFYVAHFTLDQFDGECLNHRGLSGFDLDNPQQSGQVLLGCFQGVAPARAALDSIDHGFRPDIAINSPRAQAVSGGSVRYSESMSSSVSV
ncbi:hypothetical protein [Pseudomonas syringae group sp. J254-4]|uniref:hypothetical protein n=1 Tax=Pseudomonas syringae group sp. J254-4 TaxID=3079589 RepID=UPI00290EE7A9|nr:hypothetical protein [Pseudomonas syringae group sp. J254-4]MDU8456215.1 hypothetical protein [Pseudomonas syringae group sp. J254-4]